jgi:hypothetical protein
MLFWTWSENDGQLALIRLKDRVLVEEDTADWLEIGEWGLWEDLMMIRVGMWSLPLGSSRVIQLVFQTRSGEEKDKS